MSPCGRSGETSWPGSRAPAGSLVPDRDWKPLRCRSFLSLAQGRHPDVSGPLALGDGSCLLSLKLLSCFSGGRPFGLPLARRLLPPLGSSPGATGASPGGAHFAEFVPFFSPRLRHRGGLAAFEDRPSPPGPGFPALARSHNLRSGTDCVRPSTRNHRSAGRHWASRVICVLSAPQLSPQRPRPRSPPGSRIAVQEDATPPAGTGDICLGSRHT